MFDDEDVWAAFASSVFGLVLSALSVSDMMTCCLSVVGKISGSFLHWRKTCPRSIASPRRRKEDIDDDVGVDVDVD
jgi:hypothetical protein